MKYLITGAKGQLAKEFIKALGSVKADFLALDRNTLDISNFWEVMKVVREYKPHVILNCAAYNYVDKAESDFHSAYKVNVQGVYNLALASLEVKAKLIHYSTDYVFDGKKEGLYTEEDTPNPLNKYALSKLLGEEVIRNTLEDYLILRVSWVYGSGSQNFLYKLLEWSKNNDILKVACDEFSVPTSTTTIVEVSLKAISKGLTGLYHLTNSGYASRYEWAKEFFKIKGINKFIYPVYQSDFNLPAKRPRWSAMSNEKISKELDIEIREWREELERVCLDLT